MLRKIERDVKRFRQIVRGVVKKDFRKYLTQGELIGRQGRHVVSIPLPQIEIPRFRFGQKEAGGVGQGEGERATAWTAPPASSPATTCSRSRSRSTSWPPSSARSWSCPASSPAAGARCPVEKVKYSNVRRVGPESLRHFKRTFREALKRQIASGAYDPARPFIVPIREDRRYRSWHVREVPESNAVDHPLHGRVAAAWATSRRRSCAWRRSGSTPGCAASTRTSTTSTSCTRPSRKEVDQHTFYHLRESGGTRISAAYELINAVVDARFPPDSWNVYVFHFSDGENGDSRDTEACMELLRKELLPKLNLFCFGQVRSSYGGGRFKNDLEEAFPGEPKVVTSEIRDKDEIYDAMKRFLGKGL